MNNKTDRARTLFHSLKFQQVTRLVAFMLVMVLLTIAFSVKASTPSAPLLGTEAEASALVCPADIISYWKLDEDSGTTFADSILENDATCTGATCPAVVSGIDGSALDFDAGELDELTVDHDLSLNWSNSTSFSIEVWFKTTQVCDSDNKVIVGKYSGTGAWWVGCSRLSLGDATSVAAFYLRDTDGNAYSTRGTSSIVDDEWHHLVAIRDANLNKHLLYLDGSLQANVTPDATYTGDFSNGMPLEIASHDNQYHFDGIIDEIALYNRVLTEDEIDAHYNGGAGQPYCSEAAAPQIDPIPDQSAVVGQLFTYDVEASVGTPPPTFSLTQKPDATMTIDAGTGVIEWTPGATGTYDVTVSASNSEGSDTESFAIVVSSAPAAPVITAIPDQNATEGKLFTYDVDASGFPAPTFTLTEHPTGMTINSTTGVINWTPGTTGDFDVTVAATNSEGTSPPESFTITVLEAEQFLFLPLILRNP